MPVTFTVQNNNNGTASFTVSGGLGGAPNDFYYSTFEDPNEWILIAGGPMIGDGTTVLTVSPGMKWFVHKYVVVGQPVYNPPQAMIITESAVAVYERIIQAVGDTIRMAATSGQIAGYTAENVDRKDEMAGPGGVDLSDMRKSMGKSGMLVYGPGLQENFTPIMNASDDYDYPVLFAAVDYRSGEDDTQTANYLMARQVVRNLFNQRRIAGVPESKSTRVEFEVVLDYAGRGDSDIQFASALRIIASTRENRWT